MQQAKNPIDAAAEGLGIVNNIVEASQRAKQSALQRAIAQQELQHAAVMNPLQEQLMAAQVSGEAEQGKTNLEKAKADIANLTSEAHYKDLLAPHLGAYYDAHSATMTAQANKDDAQAGRYKALTEILNTTGGGKGGKAATSPLGLDQIISSLDPNDPNSVAIGTRLVMAANRQKLNPGGMFYMESPDAEAKDTAAIQAAVAGGLGQRQQLMQKQQAGQGLYNVLQNIFSSTKQPGGSADTQSGSALPKTPKKPTPLPPDNVTPTAGTSLRTGNPWSSSPYGGASAPPIPGFGQGNPLGGGAPMDAGPAAPSVAAPTPAPTPPASVGPPVVKTPADYAALPIGAIYIAPNGQPKIKRGSPTPSN